MGSMGGVPRVDPIAGFRAAAGVDTHPGDAQRLKEYWEHGAGAAQIGWGTPGDFDRCVAMVTEHAHFTPEQADGYCNERHHAATGMWPSQHAALVRDSKASAADPAAAMWTEGLHPRNSGRFAPKGKPAPAGKPAVAPKPAPAKPAPAPAQRAPAPARPPAKPKAPAKPKLTPQQQAVAHVQHVAHLIHLAHVDPQNNKAPGSFEVRQAQIQLNTALGLKPPLKVDGVFGPKTLAATQQLSTQHGAKVPAKPKTPTVNHNAPAAPKAPSAPKAPAKTTHAPSKTKAPVHHKPATPRKTSTALLGFGKRGAAVSSLQAYLNKHGAKLQADGIFGPKTQAAVRAFQKSHGLVPDGIVGPKTRAAMRAKTAAPKAPAKTKSATVPKVPAVKKTKPAPVQPIKVTVAAGPQLVTIPNVDLLAVGTWELSSGRQTFTRQDMADAIEAAKCPAVGNPVIKLGHIDPRFDGQPALGHVANMRPGTTGAKLVGDLTGMPGWLASISASAFPRRSVEGSYNFRCQVGHDHRFVLTGLALLGVTAPGVGVLNTLGDIAALYGLAAAAPDLPRSWSLEFGEGEPVVGVSEEDVRRAYYATGVAPPDWWITELQMQPAQLIVAAGDGKIFRVPYSIVDDNHISFAAPVELADYAALAASRGTGPVVTYASAAVSRSVEAAVEGEAEWDGEAAAEALAKVRRLRTLVNATVRAAGDPDDDVRQLIASLDATLDEAAQLVPADTSALPADIGQALALIVAAEAIVDQVMDLMGIFDADDDDDTTKAAAGDAVPNKGGAANSEQAPDDGGADTTPSATHPPMTTGAKGHTHPHPAYGTQGGDTMHGHKHVHNADNDHDHAHATASAGRNKDGGSAVEFTDAQLISLRDALRLPEDEEMTPEGVVAAVEHVSLKASQTVAAAARSQLPPGVMTVDREAWDALNRQVAASAKFREEKLVEQRDEVIAQAVRDGKFSAARVPLWRNQWDANPTATRETIASLTKNVVPVDDIGGAGGLEGGDDVDREFASLWPGGTFKAGR